jgi:hypothetical protein
MSPFGMSVREFFLNLAANVAAAALSPADMIGYLIAVCFVLVWIVSWHRKRTAGGKRGLDSWYFIALSFLIAVIAVGGAAYGIGLRSVGVKQPATNSSSLIKDVRIDWVSDGSIWLTGTYVTAGTELVAYAAVFSVETFNTMSGTPRSVMMTNSPALGPRIETDKIDRFGRETIAKIKIGTLINNQGNWVLQLGQSSRPEAQFVVSRSGYFGVIYLVEKDNDHQVPFAIISRKLDQKDNPLPVFIGPDVLLSYLSMLPNAEK